MRQSVMHRILWGIVPLGIGVVFLLNNLGVTNMDVGELFRTFWPVFLILVGIQGLLFQPRGRLWWNPLIVLLGVFFLGRNLHWFEWDLSDLFRLIVPVILILVGLSIIFRGARRRDEPEDHRWNPIDPPSPPPGSSLGDVQPPPPPPPPFGAGFEEGKGADGRGAPPREPGFAEPPPDASGAQPRETVSPKGSEHWKHQYWREHHQPPWKGAWFDYDAREHHSRLIGDTVLGHDYFELRPTSISHFIGDTTLDLTRAQIAPGETKIYISTFIGDVNVFIPNDFTVGVRVVSSTLMGVVTVLDRKRGGLFNQMNVETPGYADSAKQVVIVVSSFIGDVRVTKVG